MRTRNGDSRQVSAGLGDLLRFARRTCGMSQLELALRLGVSQRHVSFLEHGKARPSRPLLLAWMQETGADPSLSNAALCKAGQSSDWRPTQAQAVIESAREALFRAVELHAPNPGLVFDPDWRAIRMNRVGLALAEHLMPGLPLGEPGTPLDMIGTISHADGWLARARRPDEVGAALLAQLQTEQWVRPALAQRVECYRDSLVQRFGTAIVRAPRAPGVPYLDLTFDTDLGPLSFFAVQTVFGLPHDVSSASLRAELWYAADAATASTLQRISAAGRSG